MPSKKRRLEAARDVSPPFMASLEDEEMTPGKKKDKKVAAKRGRGNAISVQVRNSYFKSNA
jgi:hypothetical protein